MSDHAISPGGRYPSNLRRDGSNLTSRGLPTPDLFTGGHNFHTRLEFNSRRGMEKTVEMLVQLVQIYAKP